MSTIQRDPKGSKQPSSNDFKELVKEITFRSKQRILRYTPDLQRDLK